MAITTAYEAPTGDETTVEVTFTSDSPSLTHVRTVNAVFTEGNYDEDATAVRVAEVAAGVEIIAPEGFYEHSISENIIGGKAMKRRQFIKHLGAIPLLSSGLGASNADAMTKAIQSLAKKTPSTCRCPGCLAFSV